MRKLARMYSLHEEALGTVQKQPDIPEFNIIVKGEPFSSLLPLGKAALLSSVYVCDLGSIKMQAK